MTKYLQVSSFPIPRRRRSIAVLQIPELNDLEKRTQFSSDLVNFIQLTSNDQVIDIRDSYYFQVLGGNPFRKPEYVRTGKHRSNPKLSSFEDNS